MPAKLTDLLLDSNAEPIRLPRMLSGNCRSRTEHWISRNRGQKDSAYAAVWDAEYEVMEAKPATPAGGVALLRFVAGLMEDLFPDDDEHDHYAGAIRNAADFFEGSASA